MSHAPERQEKDCLNCGTIVQGRYCQHCGQENIVPRETFTGIVTHFFNDITHFDGKFFHSLKYLFTRPGFLPKEYQRGRRARYLNPIRMYVFTSAFFFLIFFTLFRGENSVDFTGNEPLTPAQRDSALAIVNREISSDSNNVSLLRIRSMLRDTSKEVRTLELPYAAGKRRFLNLFGKEHYDSEEEYKRAQQQLPAARRDGWLKRKLVQRQIHLNEKYRSYDPKEAWAEILDEYLHKLPYILFISLPVFALVLQLLYIRRKQYYYVDHGIFSIYHYIFTFLILLPAFLFSKLKLLSDLAIFNVFELLINLYWLFYLYKSMRKFYEQNRAKTILKFLLLCILAFTVNLILFVIFFIINALFA